MYFLDEKNGGEKVWKCPDCDIGEIIPWVECPSRCPSKKVAEEHRKVVCQMLETALPNLGIKPVFIDNVEMLLEYKNRDKRDLAWANPVIKELYIPWYILRSKWQFFNIMMHEMAHFIAYERKCSEEEKKIFKKLYELELKNEIFSSPENKLEVDNYYLQNYVVVDRYVRQWEESKGNHCFDLWHRAYKKLFWDFYNSEFKKYTYGKISKPLKYGFSEDGKGKYEEEIVEYK